MIEEPALAPGTRVRLRGHPIAVELRSPDGVVVRPDEWDLYYIIRLDRPALYRRADGATEELPEIREALDNMDVLSHPREVE